MKILLSFQTKAGQIDFTARLTEPPQSPLEKEFQKEVVALLNEHIPVIGKKLGAPAATIIDHDV